MSDAKRIEDTLSHLQRIKDRVDYAVQQCEATQQMSEQDRAVVAAHIGAVFGMIREDAGTASSDLSS